MSLAFELEYSLAPMPVAEARRKKAEIPERLRWAVWQRDDFRCVYCGNRRYLTLDHLVPEHHGGATDKDNLVTACGDCNVRKSTLPLGKYAERFNRRPPVGCYVIVVEEFWPERGWLETMRELEASGQSDAEIAAWLTSLSEVVHDGLFPFSVGTVQRLMSLAEEVRSGRHTGDPFEASRVLEVNLADVPDLPPMEAA